MKTVTPEQVNIIMMHFELLLDNHRYLAYSFRPIKANEVLMAMLKHLDINFDKHTTHDIDNDAEEIAEKLKTNKIFIPII